MIALSEIGVGAYPQFSGRRVQVQLTAKRAAWLILRAERIDGRAAEALGIVNRSVLRTELMMVAIGLGQKLSLDDDVAISAGKRTLDVMSASISWWRQAFVYGMATKARIRSSGEAQQEGFWRFSAGRQGPRSSCQTARIHVRRDNGSVQ